MKKFLYLMAILALPRVYMLDWSSTPTELMENYITSSTDFVMPTGDGHIVFIADMVPTCEVNDEETSLEEE